METYESFYATKLDRYHIKGYRSASYMMLCVTKESITKHYKDGCNMGQ